MAGLYVSNPGGTLAVYAGGNINTAGAQITSGGSVELSAKGDVTLDSVTTGQSETIHWSSRNSRIDGSSSETGTTVSGGTNVAISAGGDLTARAANLSAGNDLSLDAAGQIVLYAGQNQTYAQTEQSQRKGMSYSSLDASSSEPVYPEGWLLDAKAALDLGKLGVRLVSGASTGAKGSLDALAQLAKTDVLPATGANGGTGSASTVAVPVTHRPIPDLLAEANTPINDAGISQAARAWDKHSGRSGGTFEPLAGTTAEKNAAASNWISDVLSNPQTTVTQLPRGGVSYRLPNGQGVVFELGGKVNLLDPKRPK